jgi:hypothetical protein
MYGEPTSTGILRGLARLLKAPLELRAFAVFSVLVSVLHISLPFIGPKHFREFVVPITGWMPGIGYMFGLYFTFALVFMRPPQGNPHPIVLADAWNPWLSKFFRRLRQRQLTRPYSFLRAGFVAPLLLQIFFGYFAAMIYNGVDYGNRYLRVSPWQTLWTMWIPALWILVLFSPRMNRFCRRAADQPGET